ncbi:MAG: agmatinase [Pseudomonadota bacterium]
MSVTTTPPGVYQTFLFSELQTDLDALSADIAVLGVPFGQPYGIRGVHHDHSNGPSAIRQASDRVVRALSHYDFDIGGPLFMGRAIRMVDCGDVAADPFDLMGHFQGTEAAVTKILKAGALPLVLGGDHSIPIPVIKAYGAIASAEEPITLIQLDAHLDWREEVGGVTQGLSSTIRRASEMAHVGAIYQIGLRAQGSARPADYEAALAYGSNLITADRLHEEGAKAILDLIPDAGCYYITIDMDGLDPSYAPAVAGPAPGGITWMQARALIQGLVRKGRVVGMDVVELTPAVDVNRISAITAGRLFVNLIGTAAAEGYFD